MNFAALVRKFRRIWAIFPSSDCNVGMLDRLLKDPEDTDARSIIGRMVP